MICTQKPHPVDVAMSQLVSRDSPFDSVLTVTPTAHGQTITQGEPPREPDILVRLQHVHSLLDISLGDTDPYFEDGMTQEEIELEDPVFAACIILAGVIAELRAVPISEPPR